MVFMAICTYFLKPIERISGEKALPYVIVGIVMAVILVDRYFYERCPRRLVIPIGVIGWLVTFLLLFLRNWYRGGA